MNYFDLYSSYPDRTIAATWDSQVKEADQTPWLAGTLTECGDELFTRFAACYAELRALPRSARRALQRRIARSNELAAILPDYLQQGGRRLQHRMAWSLAGAALLLALGQGVATAATITVTTNDPRIIPDGQCSLVEAIVNANDDAATHADCPAGSGADTIVLPANGNVMLSNVYCISYTTTPFCDPVGLPPIAFGLPPIASRITIEGNGAIIAREGNAPAFGLIAVRGNRPLGVGLPPRPGDLTLQSVTLSGGSSFGGLLNRGTASIKNSVISGNTGSGVYNHSNYNSATLSIESSIISGNTGRGVSNTFHTVTIENSTISGNTGGGVSNGGTLTIANSTISGNTTNFGGGGVSNSGGRLAITNSTISSNRANRGGGISNSQYCYYYISPGCTSGTLTLNNSLIAGNQAPVAPEIENDASSIVTANNFNLFGSNGNAGVIGFTPGPTDIVPGVSLAQILGPLKNNRGPTQTHALLPGSPAIDAGDPGGCRDSQGASISTDQRGFARHIDGNNDGAARCDIGAVEFSASSATLSAGSATLIDFDGDGITDIGVYRDGMWFIRRSSDGGLTGGEWGGAPQDIPVPTDYDGDGKSDIAVYRDGTWFIRQSSDGGLTAGEWGGALQDIPVPADYDGDGKSDIAVYRDGMWFIRRSSDGGLTAGEWGGAAEDIPVPTDYDGDGKSDIAVYRDGTWFIRQSSDGGLTGGEWGGALQDIPVPADYDGDGKSDIAVYRDGTWFIRQSSDGGLTAGEWGGALQDIPVPADYDGDGKSDIAVYRDGMWFIRRSSDGGLTAGEWGGAAEDIPLK
jgi:hypothetical protein